jgi:hypothetical protein
MRQAEVERRGVHQRSRVTLWRCDHRLCVTLKSLPHAVYLAMQGIVIDMLNAARSKYHYIHRG